MSPKQSTGEHAMGGDADSELAARRKDRVFDIAREQGIIDLEVGDGMDGCGEP